MAEWPVCQTHNPAVAGVSPTLTTCWICSWLPRVQILGYACSVIFEYYLFLSILSGVPVNKLDKLSTHSTINTTFFESPKEKRKKMWVIFRSASVL